MSSCSDHGGPAMRHALFIAYHYPPESSSSGVLRTLKHTRYLGRFGWRVTVLTLRREAYQVMDPKLEEQIPPEVRVVRTRFIDVKKHLAIRGSYPSFLAIPDRWSGWWPWAVAAGRKVLAGDPVDLVYSTSPHATAHLIARSLAGRALRWVADFRDPWYEEPPEAGTTRLGHVAARRLERLVARRADLIVTSTMRLRNVLASRYPEKPSEKFVAIPNGYDEADFTSVLGSSASSPDEFLIVHAGSLSESFRDPRPLFEAVHRAAQMGLVDPSRIRFRFLGGGPFGESAEMKEAVKGAGLVSRVEFLPRVSYQESLAELGRASMLLLLQASKDTVDLVPAKLFEYLRAGRPVLALAPPGATAEVLSDTGGGWVVDPTDMDRLGDAIVTAYRAWTSGDLGRLTAPSAMLEQYSRERLAGDLAGHFETLLERSR
jgi:glycosyltransferase involved in cell wall biosynthesis